MLHWPLLVTRVILALSVPAVMTSCPGVSASQILKPESWQCALDFNDSMC